MRSLIILVSIVAVAATVATLIIGSRTFEGLVVDKPYETGLAWDQKIKNDQELGWKIALLTTKFRTGMNDLYVRMSDKNGKTIFDVRLNIAVSRPSTREYDRQYQMASFTENRYFTQINLPFRGVWDIDVEAINKTHSSTFHLQIFAEETKS